MILLEIKQKHEVIFFFPVKSEFYNVMYRMELTKIAKLLLINSRETWELHLGYENEQQVVTLRVCASRWTEVCGGIGSQRMQQRKMAPLLKITIVDHLFYLCGVQIRRSLFCNMRDWSQG